MRRRTLLCRAAEAIAVVILGGTRVGADQQTGARAVEGTAFAAGRSATGPPVPMTGLMVVLLPMSDRLLEELERLRHRSRDSLTAYRSTIPEMRRLVEAAVAALRADGQDGTIRIATVDEGGRFSLAPVPPGNWIILGLRTVHVDRASSDTARESGTFLPQPRLVGYDRVLVWLRSIAVGGPARAESVDLTDRNVWFEGVEETRAARERAPNTGGRRRSAN